MERTLQGNTQMAGRSTPVSISRGLGWGFDRRTGRHDDHGPDPHGRFICTWIASSDMLLDRWKYRCAFLFDPRCGNGTRHSTGRAYALSGRTADRSNLWDTRGTGRRSTSENLEKEHHRSDYLRRDPEPANPGDDPILLKMTPQIPCYGMADPSSCIWYSG